MNFEMSIDGVNLETLARRIPTDPDAPRAIDFPGPYLPEPPRLTGAWHLELDIPATDEGRALIDRVYADVKRTFPPSGRVSGP